MPQVACIERDKHMAKPKGGTSSERALIDAWVMVKQQPFKAILCLANCNQRRTLPVGTHMLIYISETWVEIRRNAGRWSQC